MREGVPEHWPMLTLAEVSELKGGLAKGKKRAKDEVVRTVPYLRVANVQAGYLNLSEVHSIDASEVEISKILLQDGDVLFNEGGDRDKLGRGWVWEGQIPECIHQNHVFRARPRGDVIDPFFLSYWGNSRAAKEYFEDEGKQTVNLASISLAKLGGLPVPVPPLEEQRRIVAKLEALLAKVDTSRKRLERIPTILKRFRQAVLAAACEGRLTEDWRDENPSVAAADSLFRVINETRAKTLRIPRTASSLDSASNRMVSELENPFHPDSVIPLTWAWVRFGDVIGELRNGISTRPEMEPPGTPILRISAVRGGSVDLNETRFLPNGDDHVPSSALREGDLLFTRYNGSIELLGVCGMVRDLKGQNLLYPDKLMRVRFDHEAILPAYAEIYFQSSKVHDRITEKSKSSAGQNGVSGSDIKAQAFALPPIEEQSEIVRRVAQLFTLADQIEARYFKAKTHVDRLTQSILAKAFRGDLVPQDPSDESAEMLLARLKTQSAAVTSPKRRRRPKKAGG